MGYARKSVPAKVEAKFQNGVVLPWYFSPSPPWFLALVSSLHNPAQPLRSQTFSVKDRTFLKTNFFKRECYSLWVCLLISLAYILVMYSWLQYFISDVVFLSGHHLEAHDFHLPLNGDVNWNPVKVFNSPLCNHYLFPCNQ